MIKKFHCQGYTLIELLVVISISALFFSLALASYQSFNKNQALKNASSEIKSVLRDVQNRAITGQKDTSACSEHTDNPILLVEWRFSWTSDTRNYSIEGVCKSGSLPQQTFGLQTFTLPATDNIKFRTGGTISFKPLNQGIDLNLSPPICIKGDTTSSLYYKITVEPSGGINVDKVQTCP